MSLADELLADLEEAGDEGEDGLYPEGEEGDSDGEETQGRTEGRLEDIPEEMEVDYSKAESVASIAKLRNSKQVSSGIWQSVIYINESVLVSPLSTFIFSFQKSWTKFRHMLENSARTQKVSGIHREVISTQFYSRLFTKNLSCILSFLPLSQRSSRGRPRIQTDRSSQ